MNSPLLSIIVPVYNVEAYLDECVQSILAQDFTDWEMLLVDDGSQDQSGAKCDQWAERDQCIRVLHQENQGQAAARNHALDIARGQYITFVDSDDSLAPNTYGPNMAYLVDHPEVELLQFPTLFDSNLPTAYLRSHNDDTIEGTEAIFLAWHNADPINKSLWNKIYRSSLLHSLRFMKGHLHEDFFYLMELMPRVQCLRLSAQGCYHYRANPTSTLHTANLQKDRDWVDAELQMVEQMQAYRELRPELLPRYMEAARYLMNTILPFPEADLTPQLQHLRQARPHHITLRSARKKDLFWYLFLTLLGPKAFYLTYRKILLRHQH